MRDDPYDWLRDPDWQRVMREPERLAADIRAHLEAENAHTTAVLHSTVGLQQRLFAELKGRIQDADASVPTPDGAYAYFARYEAGAQHPRFCRRPSADETETETVLFDADAAAQGHAFFDVGGVEHSPDHCTLARAIDLSGSEFYTLRFRDLEQGRDLPDVIERCGGQVVWSRDSGAVFYTLLDDQHRPYRVMRHVLGTPVGEDRVVFEDRDPGFFLGVDSSEDRAFVVVSAHDHATSEVWLVAGDDPDAQPLLVARRRPGHEYALHFWGDRFVVLTNDSAEDFKLMEAPLSDPRPESWRKLVPHRPSCLILDVMTFADYLVRLERVHGLPRIVIRHKHDGTEHTIAFDEEAYSLGLQPGYAYATAVVRFSYSSLTTPEQVFDYDMGTRVKTLRKTQQVPSGHDPSHYRSKRVYAPSHDGESVPVSLVWHRDTPLDGTAPVFLYGYGAYGHAMPAAFSSSRLSLVDRGFIYAVAHVRGGKDKGYGWYRRGKLTAKKNTFFDFIAAAEHLCTTGITTAGNITIQGGSAGGMLVGAVTNMRPELFKAVIAEVPFVDVLNTMCDPELPLTPPEWPEWGNPIEDAEAYRYIASYSPYDNVEPTAYPHILATAGLTDPRVTYWEPAKWVAKLRECKTNDTMLVLKTYMEAGHRGAAGRFEKLREVALVYAFALLAHGLLEAGAGQAEERDLAPSP